MSIGRGDSIYKRWLGCVKKVFVVVVAVIIDVVVIPDCQGYSVLRGVASSGTSKDARSFTCLTRAWKKPFE